MKSSHKHAYNFKDIVGMKMNRLKIISFARKGKRCLSIWNAVCDCGNKTEVLTGQFLSGKKKSCGCIVHEKRQNRQLDSVRAFKRMFRAYYYGALRRGLDFNLTQEQFERIVYKPCFWCGSDPQELVPQHGEIAQRINGIDRLDNNKGYVECNCVPSCRKCNLMKLDMSEKDFIYHVSKIYNNRKCNA